MAVTSIKRDYGIGVNIVRLVANNTLAEVAASGYIAAQASVINALNNGGWQWLASDLVAVRASNGTEIYKISNDFSSLEALGSDDLTVTVAMTAAEWNGMYAAPKALIAAPGANNVIVVSSMVAAMHFVAASYAAGGDVVGQYGNTVHAGGTAATSTVAAATVNALAADGSVSFTGVGSVNPDNANQGLYLSNATGAFTTGDGTWLVTVSYRIVNVA